MNPRSVIIGNKLRISPEGAGSLRETKPADNATTWLDYGLVEGVHVNHTPDEQPIYAPTPGRYRKYDVLSGSSDLDFTIDCGQLSGKIVELLFGAAALTNGGTNQTYVPLSGAEKRAWVEIKQYDQSDVLVNTFIGFCALKLANQVDFTKERVKPVLAASLLYSTLNSGTLT